MDSMKSESKARRSFLFKSGVALTGALAATVASPAKPAKPGNQDEDMALRLGKLEDANAVRDLYRTYESGLDQGRYEEIANHFAIESEAVFGGTRFAGRDNVRRLFTETFREGRTGKKVEVPATLQAEPLAESVEISADRKSAKATFPYAMRVGEPMDANLQLVQMARLQGGGIWYRQESGLCEVAFVKDGASWKIAGVKYRAV